MAQSTKHKAQSTIIFSVFWLAMLVFSSQSMGTPSSIHQVTLTHKPLFGLTSCPMSISASAGGQTVQCIKFTRPTSSTCTSACSVTLAGSVSGGSFTLPVGGGTIQYTLDGLNASFTSFSLCANSCVGTQTSSLKLTLYSDAGCTTPICTTGCNNGVSCPNQSTLSGCPTTPLSCS